MNMQLNSRFVRVAACWALLVSSLATIGTQRDAHALGASTSDPAIRLSQPVQEDERFRAKGSSVQFRAWLETAQIKPGETTTLKIEATPDDTWHLYGYTKEAGKTKGYMPTLILLSDVGSLSSGEPTASPEAIVKEGKPIHKETVVWSIELKVPADAEPGEINIAGSVGYQACDPSKCERPISIDFSVSLTVGAERGNTTKSATFSKGEGYGKLKKRVKELDSAKATPQNNSTPAAIPVSAPIRASKQQEEKPFDGKETYRSGHVEITARLEPSQIKPGESATLYLSAKPDRNWHIYGYSPEVKKITGGSYTLIGFTQLSGFQVESVTPSSSPKMKKGTPVHSSKITWEVKLTAPANATPGPLTVNGGIGFQVCDPSKCDRPSGAIFSFPVEIAAERGTSSATVLLAKGSYKKTKDMVNNPEKAQVQSDEESATADSGTAKSGTNIATESATQASDEHTQGVDEHQADSPEELAAMAKLYRPGEKIKIANASETTFWAAMLGAFLGGMILNLMPCVFPVLGLKVLGFVEMSDNEPAKIRMHGIAFGAGLVFCMWVLAGAILYVKYVASDGNNFIWGSQMSNSYFVGGIVILLFMLGLNLAGLFEIGLFMTRMGASGGKGDDQKGYSASFFSGILTTLVATPCSGPFLGAAMGYTLSQPATIAMLLFTVFGIGIAFPYVVLAFFPSLIQKLPRPGAWMETFKKMMAFTLFAAAAFFVQSFGSQTGVDGLSWFLMALCVLALAGFFYGKWSPAYVNLGKRLVWGWAAPLLVGGLGIWMYIGAAQMEAPEVASESSAGSFAHQMWQPGRVEKLLAENKIVWVDYTADW